MFNVVVTRSILNRNKAIYSKTPYNRPLIIRSPLYMLASWKLNTTCFPWLADVKALLADDKSPVARLCCCKLATESGLVEPVASW